MPTRKCLLPFLLLPALIVQTANIYWACLSDGGNFSCCHAAYTITAAFCDSGERVTARKNAAATTTRPINIGGLGD